MNKKIGFTIVLIGIFLLSISVVSAVKNPFETIAHAFGDKGLGEVYDAAPQFFDSLILVIIFISIGMISLKDRFDTRAGKAMMITISIALAISLELFLYNKGWHLSKLGPVALSILIAVVAYQAHKLLKSLGMEESKAGMLTFIVAYSFIRFLMADMLESVMDIGWIGFIMAMVDIGMLIIVILLVWWAITKLMSFGANTVGTGYKEYAKARKDIDNVIDTAEEYKKARAKNKDISKNKDELINGLLTTKELLENVPEFVSENKKVVARAWAKQIESHVNKLRAAQTAEESDRIINKIENDEEKVKVLIESIQQEIQEKVDEEEKAKKAEEKLEKFEMKEGKVLEDIKDSVEKINNMKDIEDFKKKISKNRRYTDRRLLRQEDRAEAYKNVLKKKFPDQADEIEKKVDGLKSFTIKIIQNLDEISEMNIGASGVSIEKFKEESTRLLEESIKLNNSMIIITQELVELSKK